MLVDIVVDTNVWAHAANPDHPMWSSARRFCALMLETETSLCVDEGFSLDESSNQSLIGHEYLEHVRPVHLGFHVLAHLFANDRVSFVLSGTDNQTKATINGLIANTRDRVFVKVTVNSQEMTLVSHDFTDFDDAVRNQLQSRLGVEVVAADEGSEALAS